MTRANIKKSKRIVIKIGTSVLTSSKTLSLDKVRVGKIVRQVLELLRRDHEVILVSSGAIGAGMNLLGLKKRPASLPEKQACAAVGQGRLMNTYEGYFRRHGFHAAQILLTWEDIRERRRYLNAENTIHTLLNKKVVPIINENDTVSVDEIKFGDNDRLSALVANLCGADLLVMLTDVEGFCDKSGKRIKEITEIDHGIKGLACDTKKECSTGGMTAKLEACKIAVDSGIGCVIANGRKKDIVIKVLNGDDTGTFFLPTRDRMQARKRWIAYNAKEKGTITVDDGAKEALINKGKSLLACGVKSIEGDFAYGDVVIVAGSEGHEFARGLTNYGSADLDKIKGLSTKQVESIIKERFYQEVIHRDNLVIK